MKNKYHIKTKDHEDGFVDSNLTVAEWEVKSKEFYNSLKVLELTHEQKKRIDESEELSGLFNRIARSFQEEEE